jgi:hypothetical protein
MFTRFLNGWQNYYTFIQETKIRSGQRTITLLYPALLLRCFGTDFQKITSLFYAQVQTLKNQKC